MATRPLLGQIFKGDLEYSNSDLVELKFNVSLHCQKYFWGVIILRYNGGFPIWLQMALRLQLSQYY